MTQKQVAMVGRTREFDIENATEIAMNLFWANGCDATSLQDLIEATSLSKSSFYQAFGSKQELFQRCLGYYEDHLVACLMEAMDEASSGRAFIESVLTGIADETRGPLARRGCLIMNTASEFAQSDPAIAKSVLRGKNRMLRIFATAVTRAQEANEVSAEWEPNHLAEYLVTCTTGLKAMAKAGNSKNSILRIANVMLAVLDNEP